MLGLSQANDSMIERAPPPAIASSFGMKQGTGQALHDAFPQPVVQPDWLQKDNGDRPTYSFALCFSGLDDGPLGDLPFLLPSQLANIIPAAQLPRLNACLKKGRVVFDLFAYVSISSKARPNQADRDAYDAAVTRIAKAAGVTNVRIKHGVDSYIQPHPLDSRGNLSIMSSSHGQLQNWLQQVHPFACLPYVECDMYVLMLCTCLCYPYPGTRYPIHPIHPKVARKTASIPHGTAAGGRSRVSIRRLHESPH
jgi:hypothetical protein